VFNKLAIKGKCIIVITRLLLLETAVVVIVLGYIISEFWRTRQPYIYIYIYMYVLVHLAPQGGFYFHLLSLLSGAYSSVATLPNDLLPVVIFVLYSTERRVQNIMQRIKSRNS
jgi:hypothetical protein